MPSYAIVGGNPAQLVRQRFDAEGVRRLLAIAWWDRPVAWITQHMNQIRGGDIDALETAVADGVID